MLNRRSLVSQFLYAGITAILPSEPQSSSLNLSSPGDLSARDGNWWLQLDADRRPTYLIGFMDGGDLGYEFTYGGIKNPKKDPCARQEESSYNSMVTKYFSNVTAEKLRDGLDEFFKEPLNRPVSIAAAVWFVLQKLAGASEETLGIYVGNARKNAAALR